MGELLIELLKYMIEKGASDLHLTTGACPRLRMIGKLVPMEDYRELTPEDTKELCYSFMTEAQMKKFETANQIDLSFGIKGLSRFRANIFMQRGAYYHVRRPHRVSPQPWQMPD